MLFVFYTGIAFVLKTAQPIYRTKDEIVISKTIKLSICYVLLNKALFWFRNIGQKADYSYKHFSKFSCTLTSIEPKICQHGEHIYLLGLCDKKSP